MQDLDEVDEQDRFREHLAAATPRLWVTPTLVGLNVLVWLANVATGVDPLTPTIRDLLAWGANHLPLTQQQPWRLFAATVLHGGALHLALNMWALWSVGGLAERFYGNKQFLLIYCFAGLFGSLASLFFSARTGVSVGASGAIFGVVGTILAALYTKQGKMPGPIVKSLRASILPFVAFSLFMGFTTSHIDNAAHLGGGAAGFLLGMILAEKFDWDEYRRQALPRAIAAVVVSLLAACLIWGWVPIGRPGS